MSCPGLNDCMGEACYANKPQTEALIRWHDEKYGTIQDKLKHKVSEDYGVDIDTIERVSIEKSDDGINYYAKIKKGVDHPQSRSHTKYLEGQFGRTKQPKEGETDVDDLDFRVGDAVTVSGTDENGLFQHKETYVVCDNTGCSVAYGNLISVQYELGNKILFRKDGSRAADNIRLYHGHDLKISVEGKKPERTVDRWVFLYKSKPTGNITTSGMYSKKRCCENGISTGENLMKYIIVSGPVKIKIPILKG